MPTQGIHTARYSACILNALVATAGLLAYLSSFSVPFVFDDFHAIISNPAIRRLWPVWGWMGGTRPVVDLTLAANYALGGLSVWGYHLFNVVLHMLVSVLVADVGRLVLENAGEGWRERAGRVGFWAGLIFAVHPLQSEAVTYVISRSELLMGFCYLLVVDMAVRGMVSKRGRRWKWWVSAVVASGLGMGSKEVMVTAPVMVWWVDVSVVSGGMRGWVRGIRERVWLYLGLAGSWSVLGYLLLTREYVGVGRGTGIGWLEYLASEFGVVAHYLRLYVYPVGLTLDYDWPVASGWLSVGVLLPGLLVVGLGVLAAWLVASGKGEWGVWIGWTLGILVPTSSVYPIADLVFEHRMYLSVAGLAVLTVMVVEVLVWERGGKWAKGWAMAAGLAAVMVLCVATIRRNHVWQDPVRLWRDTVAKAPLKPRGHNNLGRSLVEAGRWEEAIPELEKAIELDRENRFFQKSLNITASARNNLGVAYTRTGRLDEALATFDKVIKETADQVVLSSAMTNLGYLYSRRGQGDKALAYWRQAIEVLPANGPAHGYIGTMYARQGRWHDAIRYLEQATVFVENNALIFNNLGLAYARVGRYAEAARSLRRALAIDPGHDLARENLRQLPARWRQ